MASPALCALMGEAFLSRLAFGIIAFALPLYARALGMELSEIAILISFNTLVSMLLKPYAGQLADRFGYKVGALTAILARSLLGLIFAVAGAPWQLFAVQGARGLAKSLRDPAIKALIAEHGSSRTIASAFAWYKTATSAAGALGKAAAGVLLTLTASQFSLVFVGAFVISALPLLAIGLFVPRGTPALRIGSDRNAPTGNRREAALRFGSRLWPAMGFGLLVSGTAQMLRGLFPILAVEHGGLSAAETGIVYLVATIVTLAAGPLFGWLADRGNRKLVLMTRSIANIVSSAVYLVAPSFAGFATGKAIDEGGKAAFHPAWGVLMAEISGHDRSRRGRTMGYLSAAEDAGSIAGPVLAGFVWGAWGVGILLGVRMVLAVVTELYAVLVLPRALRARPAGIATIAPASNL
jgi:DHA1 family multidrug resistance protein-like MFS transporter